MRRECNSPGGQGESCFARAVLAGLRVGLGSYAEEMVAGVAGGTSAVAPRMEGHTGQLGVADIGITKRCAHDAGYVASGAGHPAHGRLGQDCAAQAAGCTSKASGSGREVSRW